MHRYECNTHNKSQKWFWNRLLQVDENSVFGKTDNVRKHRGIKLITTNRGKNQLMSEQNQYTRKKLSKKLLVVETNKT